MVLAYYHSLEDTLRSVALLRDQLDQRYFNEVYANFSIKQKFLFDGKYKAATPIE